MKIVHIIYSLNTGGSETMLVDIANEQSKTESVSLIIVNKGINESIANEISKNVTIFRIHRNPCSRNPIIFIKLNLLLKKIKPDVIHCHNHTLINLILIPLNANKYLTVHSLQYPATNLKKYDKLFAISESVKTDILSKGQYKTQVVFNGINTSLIQRKNLFTLKKPFKIVQVSRLDHEIKGQHILIEALSQLKISIPELIFTVDLIGEGKSFDYLKSLVIEKNLTECIHFLGNQPRSFIHENLHKYDLFIQPSIFEGFGLTIAEAMAAKVPVLVSNINGPMEIINNGKYGAFFESENVSDCAKKIEHIIYNYDKYSKIAEKAFKYCSENYSIKSTANNYITHY